MSKELRTEPPPENIMSVGSGGGSLEIYLFDKFLAKIYCLFGTLYISWTRRAVTTPRTRQGTNFMATPYNHRLIVNIVAESTKVAFGGNLDQFCF